MSVVARWDGLNELIQELTDAPEDVRREAFEILQDETNQASTGVDSVLRQHDRTGRLALSKRVEFPASSIIVGSIKLTAPHGHLQFGTRQRRTDRGWNRGRTEDWMREVVTVAQRHRVRMFARMREMLTGRGFKVDE